MADGREMVCYLLKPSSFLSDGAIPLLPAQARRKQDPLTGHSILLYPEGILELEETAAAFLDLCDGARSLREIARILADRYAAPPAEICRDIMEYAAELGKKGLLGWREAT